MAPSRFAVCKMGPKPLYQQRTHSRLGFDIEPDNFSWNGHRQQRALRFDDKPDHSSLRKPFREDHQDEVQFSSRR